MHYNAERLLIKRVSIKTFIWTRNNNVAFKLNVAPRRGDTENVCNSLTNKTIKKRITISFFLIIY